MTRAEKILAVARKQLGLTEFPGGSNKTKYGEWYGMDGQPWCAMFVSWVFDQSGMPLPIIQNGAPSGFAYCPYGRRHFRQKRKLFKRPKIGDIVFFNFGRSKIANHVGIVESVNFTKGTVTSIEGNTSVSSNDNGGRVMRRIRPISICFGFARPDYVSENSGQLPRFQRLLSLNTHSYMTGINVSRFQKLLQDKGYPIEVDGVFGPRTEKITRDFQADQGLVIDGIVGEKTWAAAKQEFGTPKTRPLREAS